MKILFYGFRHDHIIGLYRRALQNDSVEVVACIEEDETTRIAWGETYGIAFDTKKTYDEWLNSDVDIVAFGGAYGDRGEAAVKALKAGKHLILDKPICIKKSELKQIIKLSRAKNLKVYCMFDLRYMPVSMLAKKIIRSGELGEVRNVSYIGQHCLNYGKRPSWYFEKGKHGGTLNDLGIHGIDLIRDLTGLEFEKINASRVWNSYAKSEPDFKDCANFMATLSNGAGVIADVSYSAPMQYYKTDNYWNFKFWCEKGMLTFNFNSKELTIYDMDSQEPRVIPAVDEGAYYLDDLLKDIKSDNREFTESVFVSSKVALDVQAKAK